MALDFLFMPKPGRCTGLTGRSSRNLSRHDGLARQLDANLSRRMIEAQEISRLACILVVAISSCRQCAKTLSSELRPRSSSAKVPGAWVAARGADAPRRDYTHAAAKSDRSTSSLLSKDLGRPTPRTLSLAAIAITTSIITKIPVRGQDCQDCQDCTATIITGCRGDHPPCPGITLQVLHFGLHRITLTSFSHYLDEIRLAYRFDQLGSSSDAIHSSTSTPRLQHHA